jgi:hypothetical protein
MFTQQTAASIAIANRFAPITSLMISSGNGALAAVHREITFLIVRYSSAKCEWARISQTLARAHPRQKNLRRLQEQLVPRLKERRLRRLLLHHLRPEALRQQLLQHRPGLRLPVGLRQMHHRR